MVKSLGLITIAAGGTPVQLTTNLVSPTTTKRDGASVVKIYPHPSNAGVGYVGLYGMVPSTGVQVLGVIAKPANATTGPFEPFVLEEFTAPNGFDASGLYLDGTTNDKFYGFLVNG